MIELKELASAGTFTRTHGIHGELNATLSIDPDFLEEGSCFICDTDGILVPYFIASIRPKGPKGVLILPEDVKSDIEAKPFVGKTIYINKESYARYEAEMAEDDDFDGDGAYADDLVGYSVVDETGASLGEITDIETSTANMLFILRTPADSTLYIPVAEEFIEGIDHDSKTIAVNLPEGLVDLNQ